MARISRPRTVSSPLQMHSYGLDEETTAQLKAIAEEIDRRMLEPLKNIDPGDMTGYYETLEDHFEKKH